jgi:hypothetical protein
LLVEVAVEVLPVMLVGLAAVEPVVIAQAQLNLFPLALLTQ